LDQFLPDWRAVKEQLDDKAELLLTQSGALKQ